jgi:hypothetical protein
MKLKLFQIAYSQETLAKIEHGYEVLNNLDNPRPDWYEYWPIRKYLLTSHLDDQTFYGFFSPKFQSKTLLNYQQVVETTKKADANGKGVVLFSPQPDMAAFFLNVFEQQDLFSPGFMDISQDFVHEMGLNTNLKTLIMDSTTTVFSNYFVALPEFWRVWLTYCEKIFTLAEETGTEWSQRLTQETNYTNNAQMKVFLMERIASLLLTIYPEKFTTLSANPWAMGWSMSRLRQFPQEAIISDALKMAMRKHGFDEYKHTYSQIRNRLK